MIKRAFALFLAASFLFSAYPAEAGNFEVPSIGFKRIPNPSQQIGPDDMTRADGNDIGNQITWDDTNENNDAIRTSSTFSNCVANAACLISFTSPLTFGFAHQLDNTDDTFNAAQFAQVRLSTDPDATNGMPGPLAVRIQTASTQTNFTAYVLYIESTSVARIRLCNADTLGSARANNDCAILASATSLTIEADDVWRLEANGTTIRALQNGTERISVTDATIVDGTVGLVADFVNVNFGFSVDDFTGGNISSVKNIALVVSKKTVFFIGKDDQSINIFGVGTAQAPILSWVGDLDTGIWHPAPNEVAISTNAEQELRVAPYGLVLAELAAADTPVAANLTANAAVDIFSEGDCLVFSYNNAGVMTFVKLALDGADITLVHNTTDPTTACSP